MKKKLLICFAMLGAFVTSTVNADVILYQQDFESLALGDLVGQDGWSGHSSAGNIPVQVVAGQQARLEHGASAEDINVALGSVMGAGDVWRYSFDVNVESYAVPYYFAHFKDGGFGFNGRLHVLDATGAGDFTFGISDVGSDGASTAAFGVDFDLNTTYRVNVVYSFDSGTSEVTVDGVGGSIVSTDSDPGQAMEQFALRQTSSGANSSSFLTIDNIEVATVDAVPEPTSALLIGFAGLGLGLVRRRR